MMQMQRSPSHEEPFASCSSPSTISDHHHHHHLDFNNNTDSEARIIFADPCSMCGTKKRRVCDSPLHQQSNSRPRKKLFSELSPSFSTFQANSVCQVSFPSSSPSPSPSPSPTFASPSSPPETSKKPEVEVQQQSPESGSPRSSSRKGKKIMNSPRNQTDLEDSSDSGDDSSEKSPSPSPPPLVHHGRRTAKESPANSASLPPRPPKHRRSTPKPVPTPTPTPSPDRMTTRRGGVKSPPSASDSEGSPPPDKDSWKTMDKMMGLMNTLLASGMINGPQKEKIQETIHGKKGILEITDEDHILKGERGVYKGTCQCTCGKTYQMILSILPE